jgi:hypothetical protein
VDKIGGNDTAVSGLYKPIFASASGPRANDVDQTHSASTAHERTTQNGQNEPTDQAAAIAQSATTLDVMWPDQQNEATTLNDLPHDATGGFLSVLPRHPDQPSGIPAQR